MYYFNKVLFQLTRLLDTNRGPLFVQVYNVYSVGGGIFVLSEHYITIYNFNIVYRGFKLKGF